MKNEKEEREIQIKAINAAIDKLENKVMFLEGEVDILMSKIRKISKGVKNEKFLNNIMVAQRKVRKTLNMAMRSEEWVDKKGRLIGKQLMKLIKEKPRNEIHKHNRLRFIYYYNGYLDALKEVLT